MAYRYIDFHHAGGVALLTLNRPERLNAMHRPMLEEINAACDEVEAHDAIRALVVTGAGPSFCSGFDLKEQAANPPRGVGEWRRVLREDFDTILRFWHLSTPTIAAVRGHALAGGFELAMSCDMTVAGDDAVFGEPELMFGAGIVAMVLPWLTGPKIAKELILTANDRIPVERARAAGLVNAVVPAGTEVEVASRWATKMAAMDPGLVKHTKRAINRAYELMGMNAALEMALDTDLLIEGQGTDDKRRFLEIARERGMREAIAWRDARFPDPE